MASIEERVKNVIVDSLSVDAEKVTPDASFVDDLDADSLDQVELILALEEEFDCQIPEEDASKITTVGEAIDYLKKNVKDE
jgi:acyl carrier protein